MGPLSKAIFQLATTLWAGTSRLVCWEKNCSSNLNGLLLDGGILGVTCRSRNPHEPSPALALHEELGPRYVWHLCRGW